MEQLSPTEQLAKVAQTTRAWACYDCGKCTALCPITRSGGSYSPRRHVLQTNLQNAEELLKDGTLGACLTCNACSERCPAEVDYSGLVQKLRAIATGEGKQPECPHGGALQSMMRIMAKGGPQQDRMKWLTDDLRTQAKEGDVLYWTGCTMYYDAFFPEYGVKTLDGTRAAVKLLNKLGVEPVVSPEERCCGHDLLWNGDVESFEALAEFNCNLVKNSGAKTLITSCAECLRTWKLDYEPWMPSGVQVMHLSEYLAPRMHELKLKENGGRKVTFQDPCRLGRHLDIYDPPRDVMKAVPGVDLAEMRHSHKGATCCAGGTWSGCDRFAKKIQVERLKEARATGAEVLVSACPKCQVHFRCAIKDPKLGSEIDIEMRDVAELVTEALA